MALPGVEALRDERVAFVETMDDLTDAEFESGATLCTEWAPRDVLAHLMGVDTSLHQYLFALGSTAKANAKIVGQARTQRRERLLHRARHWAERTPPPSTQLMASFLLGDVVMHHEDVLRGLGRSPRVLSADARAAIYLEGITLGPARWLKHRVEPVDGGFAFGFGTPVSGTCEALALWLAGRAGVDRELHFEGFLNVGPSGIAANADAPPPVVDIGLVAPELAEPPLPS